MDAGGAVGHGWVSTPGLKKRHLLGRARARPFTDVMGVISNDGGPERNIINESGLYSLVLGSDLK